MEKSSFSENVRVSRIKTLLKREEKKQCELAEILDIEPQNLSRCLTSGKVSEKMCRKIVECFPEYRIEWLLGYDDFMTEYDLMNGLQYMKDCVADGIWGMIEKSLSKEGKSLKFVHRTGEHVNSSQRFIADCYYTINDRDGNELKRLTSDEIEQFEERLQDYCDFLTEKYLR